MKLQNREILLIDDDPNDIGLATVVLRRCNLAHSVHMLSDGEDTLVRLPLRGESRRHQDVVNPVGHQEYRESRKSRRFLVGTQPGSGGLRPCGNRQSAGGMGELFDDILKLSSVGSGAICLAKNGDLNDMASKVRSENLPAAAHKKKV